MRNASKQEAILELETKVAALRRAIVDIEETLERLKIVEEEGNTVQEHPQGCQNHQAVSAVGQTAHDRDGRIFGDRPSS